MMIMEKIRSCLWKLESGFHGLIRLLGPSYPSLVFRPQTTNVTALGSKHFIMSSSEKCCMKQALIFKFWVIFDKVMSAYSQKIEKKKKNPSKMFLLVPFEISNFSLSLVWKNCLFWSTKIQISPELRVQI